MRGFSLVELAIVLVILGLLTGGILAGRSLIRASELRAVGTEYQRYKTAAYAFKDKYFAIPGDFSQATRVWGRQTSNADCVTTSAAAVSAAGACDGNGGGTIEMGNVIGGSGERFQFWRQLALAGLIEGNYTGFSGATLNEGIGGTNIPASKFPQAVWYAGYLNLTASDPSVYMLDYGNHLLVGRATSNNSPVARVFTPEEAWNIDTKLDDGVPARGKVIARNWNNICARANDGSSASDDYDTSYRLNDSAVSCLLYFRQLF